MSDTPLSDDAAFSNGGAYIVLHSDAQIIERSLRGENAVLRAALIEVKNWYTQDGSVGGCDVVMDEVNEVINKLIINQ